MNSKNKYDTFLGIDNGVSGTIGIIQVNKEPMCFPIPTVEEVDFHSGEERMITRINHSLLNVIFSGLNPEKTMCFMERPMYNNRRFAQSISAARAFESVLLSLEKFEIRKEVIDSKKWQNYFFPTNHRRREKGMTKLLSNTVGKKLFPSLDASEVDDYDGILIAKYCQIVYGE